MPHEPAGLPHAASAASFARVLTGPNRSFAAANLHEWIKELTGAGYGSAERWIRPPAHDQHALEVTDRDQQVIARVEYGAGWSTRTAIGPGRGARWWAVCTGLMPTGLILAAARAGEAGDLESPCAVERLEAAGWAQAASKPATDTDSAFATWTPPDQSDATRAALRASHGPDEGWAIYRLDLPTRPIITAALTTPPGIIAALALTDPDTEPKTV